MGEKNVGKKTKSKEIDVAEKNVGKRKTRKKSKEINVEKNVTQKSIDEVQARAGDEE